MSAETDPATSPDDLEEIFREAARIIVGGGRIALIDVDRPTHRLLRTGHSFYFDRIVPFVGGLLSDREAYAYLPQSTAYLPPGDELFELLRKAGFENLQRRVLMFGAVQLLIGVRRRSA